MAIEFKKYIRSLKNNFIPVLRYIVLIHAGGCEEGGRMSLEIPISWNSKSGPRSVASACDGKTVLNLTPKLLNQSSGGEAQEFVFKQVLNVIRMHANV